MANRYAVDDANDTNGARTNPNPNLMNIVQPAAFAEVEDAPPDQRELDLRQLEHQVPDTTRGRIEWAYAYSNEDVVRALSLVRMSCILTDRDAMIGFIMAQHVDAQRIEAEASYDLYYADVTEAVIEMTLQAHTDRERLLGYRFELDRTWSEVLRTVRSWDTPQDFQETIGEEEANGGRQFYADDPIESVSEWSSGSESDTDLMPVRLTSASSSDNESVASEDAGSHVTRRVTRLGHGEGTTGQPSGRSRAATFHREQIKNHLRSVQERVDAEVGRATEGDTFSEGGYLGIMNSIKRIWEAVDHAFIE